MSLANKILVGVVAFLGVVFLVLAAMTLRMHQNWCELAARDQQQIDALHADSQAIIDGAAGRPGIRQLRLDIARLITDRGRAWFKCDAKVAAKPDEGTATVTVTIDQSDPSGIADNTTLYAFQKADVQQHGSYLGQFKVTKTDPAQKQIVIEPTYRLDAGELDRLAKAQGAWVLYDVMPRENPEIMASLSDEQKKALGFDPKRPVRDYQVLLSAYHAQKVLWNDRIDFTTRDNKRLDDALAGAKQMVEGLTHDVAVAQQDAQKMEKQRDVVVAYQKLIEQELEATRGAIARLIHANKAMAGQIAVLQREAVRRIDQRTRAMAQTGAGGQ